MHLQESGQMYLETIYILTFVNVFLSEMDATTTPVKIIAIGDMQSPETEIIDKIHFGSFIPERPISIPITIAINIGFKKDFKDSLKVCFLSASASVKILGSSCSIEVMQRGLWHLMMPLISFGRCSAILSTILPSFITLTVML